jgi:hypothetical protein
MISMVQPLHVGNALRLFIEPPAGAVRWKVLRKGSDTFTGHDDASAVVAYEGDERITVDSSFLQNQVMAFYRPFYTVDGITWTAGPTASGTPGAIFEDLSTDVLSFLRQRIESGLHVECQRGSFATDLGYIQVYTASPSLERDLAMPLVTVHLENEEPGERFLGEDMIGDQWDGIGGDWSESEGWLANVSVTLIGWSLNSDERLELRKAIKRIIIANLPVFADEGWLQCSLSQQDVDAVNGEYPAHIYQVMSTFSCLAPVRVGGSVDAISEVFSRSLNG